MFLLFQNSKSLATNEQVSCLCKHVDLLLAAVLCDLDPLVYEPDPDVVSPDVSAIRSQMFPHFFVDGQRRYLNSTMVEQAEFRLKTV